MAGSRHRADSFTWTAEKFAAPDDVVMPGEEDGSTFLAVSKFIGAAAAIWPAASGNAHDMAGKALVAAGICTYLICAFGEACHMTRARDQTISLVGGNHRLDRTRRLLKNLGKSLRPI